jgi:hypothetical protein
MRQEPKQDCQIKEEEEKKEDFGRLISTQNLDTVLDD